MGNHEEKSKKRAKRKAEELKKKVKAAAKQPASSQRVLTVNARSIVERLPPSSATRNQFELDFRIYWERIQRLSAEEAYQEAIRHIDQALREATAPIRCGRGCSACCHQQVDISAFESQKIIDFIQAHPLSIDRQKLQKQAETLTEKNRVWKSLPFSERACIFLDEHGDCRIYAARPLVCRRHFVTSDPIYCAQEDQDKIISNLHAQCEAYLSAFLSHYPVLSLPVSMQQNWAE